MRVLDCIKLSVHICRSVEIVAGIRGSHKGKS
jgi:hypothetical protein